MKEFTYTVTDPNGIHARPAGLLVKQLKAYKSTVTTQSNNTVNFREVFCINIAIGVIAYSAL